MRNGQNNCLWPRWAANFVSWESIKPTNGLSLNLFKYEFTQILHALRLCCHPDGSLNIKL